jgi:thiamine-monophosphate kinase
VTPGPEDRPGEFETIARLLRPLADRPEARGLLDDAAVVPSRPGYDLVLSKDAIVEGVHFLPDDPLDTVARKLLRVNLSDLAAKGAEPYGYLLAVAWSERCGWPEREAFAAGLAEDQARFGLTLLGGDTVSTPGPLTASVTILGWAPQGRAVSRAGARVGDVLYVTGPIGDGGLGLLAAKGELVGVSADAVTRLADRYRLPAPRTDIAAAVLAVASAAADVSDGLLADAGRIADASGVSIALELERVPLSAEGADWLASRDEREGRLWLTSAGDDYQIVFTAPPEAPVAFAVPIGAVRDGRGLTVLWRGTPTEPPRRGWTHR